MRQSKIPALRHRFVAGGTGGPHMPRLLKGIRQRGRSFFFRIRAGGSDRTITLGRDLDRAVTRALEIRRRIKAGLPPTDERPANLTVRDAVETWLRDRVQHSRHGAFAENTRAL